MNGAPHLCHISFDQLSANGTTRQFESRVSLSFGEYICTYFCVSLFLPFCAAVRRSPSQQIYLNETERPLVAPRFYNRRTRTDIYSLTLLINVKTMTHCDFLCNRDFYSCRDDFTNLSYCVRIMYIDRYCQI